MLVLLASAAAKLAARATGSRPVSSDARRNRAAGGLITAVLCGGLWAWWLRTWGMAAMTVGSVVCVAEEPYARDVFLMVHEETHVRQQREHGVVPYVLAYAADFVVGFVRTGSWREAYRGVRWEVEARQRAGED